MSYEHVVIHTRLTDRWKIDPGYVDAVTFWQHAERWRKMTSVGSKIDITCPTDIVMQYIIYGGDRLPIRKILGFTSEQLDEFVKLYEKNGTVQPPPVKMEYMDEKECARDPYLASDHPHWRRLNGYKKGEG